MALCCFLLLGTWQVCFHLVYLPIKKKKILKNHKMKEGQGMVTDGRTLVMIGGTVCTSTTAELQMRNRMEGPCLVRIGGTVCTSTTGELRMLERMEGPCLVMIGGTVCTSTTGGAPNAARCTSPACCPFGAWLIPFKKKLKMG